VLGDTLLNNFKVDEIKAVLAHEFGQHVYRDLTTGIIVQSVLPLFGFWLANGVMNWGAAFFGYQSLTDPATLPLLIIALSVFGLVTMPLCNVWSRWREVKADEYALKMSGNPQAFISAMTRLASQNLATAADPP
jgi:STE24 endopeptidase